jgi:hypothetical protein
MSIETQMLQPTQQYKTVKDLIAILSELNPDDIIVMSKDSEGNSYSPLTDCDPYGVYIPSTRYSGEILIRPELKEQVDLSDFDDEDFAEEGQGLNCVVLWPTN